MGEAERASSPRDVACCLASSQSRASWLLGQQLACHVSSCRRAQPFGKVARACLDWAMRMEKEGKDKDYDLYETVRCLNC